MIQTSQSKLLDMVRTLRGSGCLARRLDSRQQQRKHQTKGDLLVQEVLTRVGGRILQEWLCVLCRDGNNKMTSGNLHPRTTKGASDRKIEQVITLSKTVKKVSSTMIVKCNQRWGQRS